MPWVPFNSDQEFEAAVTRVITTAQAAVAAALIPANFHKNVIDPFAAIFELTGFSIANVNAWEKIESARQMQKSLGNAFGIFHQEVLGNVSGWTNLGTGGGIDLKNNSQKIIAEIKNKHNTVTGSKRCDLYDLLDDLVSPVSSHYYNWTAYYVEIVPESHRGRYRAYDAPFTPSRASTRTRCASNINIRRIDGRSFYKKVTGLPNGIDLVYAALPLVINHLFGKTFSSSDLATLNAYFSKAYR